MAGGVAGAVAKTVVAPIERVKLLLQTQGAHPRIKSGEVPPYQGAERTAWTCTQIICWHVCASRPICWQHAGVIAANGGLRIATDMPVDSKPLPVLSHHCSYPGTQSKPLPMLLHQWFYPHAATREIGWHGLPQLCSVRPRRHHRLLQARRARAGHRLLLARQPGQRPEVVHRQR